MTSEEVRAELDRTPFKRFRVHLVSGKTIDVLDSGAAWMPRNSLLVLQPRQVADGDEPFYDLISFRNIERLEHLGADDVTALSNSAG